MAEESINIALGDTNSIDYHIVTLLEKIENLRLENSNTHSKAPLQVEIRQLQFYKDIICECIASFIYIFIVCGAAAGAGHGASLSSVLLATALSAGFTMTTLTHIFGHISGAHVNPAVSIAMGITKHVSAFRAGIYIIAQFCGGIGGAAFLYVTAPGYQGNLSAALHNSSIAPWERLGIEFTTTFIIVLTYIVSMNGRNKFINASMNIGASYAACTFVSMPFLNPAKSLAPSFVLNQWNNQWVHLIGPVMGGIVAGFAYNYILKPKHKKMKESNNDDSSSMQSDEDAYDDLDKPTPPKFHGSTYNTYRPANPPIGPGVSGYCPSLTSASLYSAPPTKLERVESLYGGTKSLYCKSPPLTRANLNRSQSVYTKSNSAVNKDSTLPRPGPLVPAQSLYPMRLNHPNQNHVQNQNVQNQLQQKSESIYGVRGVTPGTSRNDNYASARESERNYPTRSVTGGNAENTKFEEHSQKSRARPDSMYGTVGMQTRRGQSVQSDDSSYSSYHSSNQRNGNSSTNSTYNSSSSFPTKGSSKGNFNSQRPMGGGGGGGGNQEVRQSPPSQLLVTAGGSSTYHHAVQHSPNSQY